MEKANDLLNNAWQTKIKKIHDVTVQKYFLPTEHDVQILTIYIPK